MSVITVKRTLRRTPEKTPPTRRSFREITRSYFAHERSRQFAIEALLFAIIVAISAWPMLSLVNAMTILK